MSEETLTDESALTQPTSDERLLAALAHGSVLLSFLGPIGPMLVWISQRRKSAYASFHALQAMGYQMAFFWLSLVAGLILGSILMCLILPLAVSLVDSSEASIFAPLWIEGGFFLLIFGIWGLYFVGGIAGAIVVLMRKDFRYPILGRKLEAYLGYSSENGSVDESKEDCFVSAICHSTAILMMWGLISPVAVWLTQKDRSPKLRFQSLQAMIYQILAVIGYFAFMLVYFLSMGGMMLAIAIAGSLSQDSGNASIMVAVMIVFVAVILLLWAAWMLALPVYYILSLVATVQTLKGRDYRYPLLGKFLARRINYDPKEG